MARRERVLVEDEEALEDLEVLFVENCAPDSVVQLLVRKRSFGFKALVGKCGPSRPISDLFCGGRSRKESHT